MRIKYYFKSDYYYYYFFFLTNIIIPIICFNAVSSIHRDYTLRYGIVLLLFLVLVFFFVFHFHLVSIRLQWSCKYRARTHSNAGQGSQTPGRRPLRKDSSVKDKRLAYSTILCKSCRLVSRTRYVLLNRSPTLSSLHVYDVSRYRSLKRIT